LQKKEKYLPLAIFTVGLMAHFEIATAATLLASLVLLVPILFIYRLTSLRTIIVSIAAFILAQFPLIVFDLRNNFLNTRGIINLILKPAVVESSLIDRFDSRIDVFGNNFIATFPVGEFLLPVLLLVILVGVLLFIRDDKNSFAEKSFVIYLVITPALLFLFFLKYSSLMWGWWILELNIYYCFLLGIVLVYLWRKTSLRLFIGGVLLIFIISYIYQTFNFYMNDFDDFGGTHKIKGKLQVIDYIYNDAEGKPFSLFIFTPPVYTYAYDYLIWWYGKNKYGYMPSKEKPRLCIYSKYWSKKSERRYCCTFEYRCCAGEGIFKATSSAF
jgi:hypothetical protein